MGLQTGTVKEEDMQAELKHIVRDVKKKLTYEDVED
jgi:hypothetical protein